MAYSNRFPPLYMKNDKTMEILKLFLVARLRVNEGSGRSSLKEEGKSQSTKQKYFKTNDTKKPTE